MVTAFFARSKFKLPKIFLAGLEESRFIYKFFLGEVSRNWRRSHSLASFFSNFKGKT